MNDEFPEDEPDPDFDPDPPPSDPLDPDLIEKTKSGIRSLVNEIAALSRLDVGPKEFYAGFLPRVVEALAAIGGVVWTMDEQKRLGIAYRVNLRGTRLRERPQDDQARHRRLIQRVQKTGEGMLVPPHAGSDDDDEAGNPTDYLLVLAPLRIDVETIGVVEIFQRPEAEPMAQKGYLRFLLQMCELADDYFKVREIRRLRQLADRGTLWTRLEEFVRLFQPDLDPRETDPERLSSSMARLLAARKIFECHEGEVIYVSGDEVVVVYRVGENLVKHTYVRSQFLDGQLPKKGDRLAVYTHVVSLPPAEGPDGKAADADEDHEQA